MKLSNILLELCLTAVFALICYLFADHFLEWFACGLIILLIWHHYNESRLLKLLTKSDKENKNAVDGLAYVSQTMAYYQKHSRQEKIKTLRLISRLNKQFQFLPDAVIICDLKGEISWCNQISQDLLGFYWHKKVERNIFNVLFYDEFKNYFKQTQRNRALILLTNEQKYLEININPYDSENVLIIIRDVTQFIRLLHSRQTFLANMNHELRTPLTVLQGYLELLPEDENNPLQQKALQAMNEQTKRMANLLQQLQLLAKIEQSDNREHREVDMSHLILSLQKNLPMINVFDHQIEFDVMPEIKMIGDEGQLQSAVSNLIYNAIRHSGRGCLIQVRWQPCEDGSGGMEFSVSDNGVGIETMHIHHLTERFYRVDESRSNQTGGSGLGLAIVKHALEQHGSTLQIQSEVGKGSRFRFVISSNLLVQEKAEKQP